MNFVNSMKSITSFFFFLFLSQHAVNASFDETYEDLKEKTVVAMQPIVEKYQQLPPQGKFGVASIGGFVGTKISIRSTGKLLRISGATFLLSEVMHQAGLLDEIAKKGDELVDINLTAEGENALKGLKQRICSTVNECRMKVRKELNMEKVRSHYQELLEKDKLGTLGFTTGAVFGLLV